MRVSPVSLNAISYNAVIRALEIIRDGKVPHSKTNNSNSSNNGNSTSYTCAANNINDETKSDNSINNDTDLPVTSHRQAYALSTEPPIVTDIFIDTVGDPAYYKSRLVQALGVDYGNFTIESKVIKSLYAYHVRDHAVFILLH